MKKTSSKRSTKAAVTRGIPRRLDDRQMATVAAGSGDGKYKTWQPGMPVYGNIT